MIESSEIAHLLNLSGEPASRGVDRAVAAEDVDRAGAAVGWWSS